jgi:hypothetical protein
VKFLLHVAGLIVLCNCTKPKNAFNTVYGQHVDGILITKKEYRERWPFKVDSLYLFRGEKLDVYVAKNNVAYAVNSIASDMADSGEFGSFQQWHLIVKNPSTEQINTRNEIEKLGLSQWVNYLRRR